LRTAAGLFSDAAVALLGLLATQFIFLDTYGYLGIPVVLGCAGGAAALFLPIDRIGAYG
jgi:hypothetical protein